ncbi:putative E3 ubiquitin-protein ligase XBOS33 [Curcuma longa]|uniref:putative E3 ubiquitin-protein ligase XBOS33 n=1 Tax=Curcuma longa TaxID=136217 RepID=UPI003D9E6221
MGNSLGCSASGERLVSAARDGDLIEARMLLEFNPGLAKYSTFRGLNSPLHFAAAKGHNEIVTLLLENGADVNLRNYCGQTALMQACRHGHWEVVQTLLIFRSIVTRADYLSGRTALHFAAVGGHVRCIRLLVADFIPSAPYEIHAADKDSTGSPERYSDQKYDRSALVKFINKPADGGITALHMASLNGYIDCVQLLLDLGANVSAVTFNYGSSSNLIGAGSTPLHYAACGGNLKCCQILLARGASRLTLNCNGWLPLDVAKIWRRRCLESLLNPNSELAMPVFPLSNYLALPLMSVLNIARECGLQPSVLSDNNDLCAVCLERTCSVAAEGCGHELCVQCALIFCSTSSTFSAIAGPPGSIPCPLCRNGIVSFVKLPSTPAKGFKPNLALTLCSPCILTPRGVDIPNSSRIEARRNRTASSELVCPLICTPFSGFIPSNYDDEPCSTSESQVEAQPQSARSTLTTFSELEKIDEQRADSSCSGMLWGRRSCNREHQCNSEINA